MTRPSFISIIFFSLLMQVMGCKKDLRRDIWEFSFTYNGQTYTNPDYGSPIEGQGDIAGIEIRKPDLFGGVIRFTWSTNCAFLQPTGMDISYNDNTCAFFVMGGAVDSSRIFTYSSGSKNYNVTNCKTKTDPFTGGTYNTCTMEGSFSLVLINNAGLTKSITGTFKDPDVIR